MVGIAERPILAQRGECARGEIAQGVHPDVACTALGGPGQCGIGQPGRGHHRGVDPGGARALERRRQRLHLARRQRTAQVTTVVVAAPPQRVQHADTRHLERVADHPVLTRGEPGADRGDARRGRRRETRP